MTEKSSQYRYTKWSIYWNDNYSNQQFIKLIDIYGMLRSLYIN